MASLVSVTDPADPRLADFVRLRDVNLRKSLEAEHGLFVAEGEKVIRRAIGAGHPVRSLLMSRRWAEPLADVLDDLDAPAYIADDATLESITGFQVHRGALASLERLPLPTVETVLTAAHRVIICEDIVDHTNVGALFRCAAALGVDAAVLAPRCADPLYRRSVKVSMGAVFALPYARMTDWRTGLSALRERGFQLLALTPAPDAVPIDEVKTADRRALLLGSEGDGLSSRWLHEADHRVRIPMNETALARGVDSLNVVAAAAIACYGLTR
ncbi:RNA methyltransferase [Actinomadura sp. 7K507]|uniref:TrmH family RNA methyltransferase n=1 Tax=Actinomadura sp. 7K507 TaxID=2530365 RepID=UPI0010509618|nr:RNA methyltransferase [Actinomadura sp. 7K507]TDC78358.1 RNA methyltransferase [Actinomadura sp. 7K507]